MNIMVTSHKGGVGKTVSAIHLAGTLARRFGVGSVGLVDLDRNRSAMAWGAEGRLPFRVVDDERVLGEEEIAVYDSQGRPDEEDLELAAAGSDMMVLVTTPREGSSQTMLLLLEDLWRAGTRDNYRVLITMVPWWNPRHARNLKKEFRDEGVPVFDAVIPQREAVEDAWEAGVLVDEVRRRNARDVWDAYRRVTDELLWLVAGDVGVRERGGGAG